MMKEFRQDRWGRIDGNGRWREQVREERWWFGKHQIPVSQSKMDGESRFWETLSSPLSKKAERVQPAHSIQWLDGEKFWKLLRTKSLLQYCLAKETMYFFQERLRVKQILRILRTEESMRYVFSRKTLLLYSLYWRDSWKKQGL